MRHLRTLARASAAAVLVAGASTGLAHATSASEGDTTTLDDSWYASAPYLMPQADNAPDPTEVMDATGQQAFQLAFILADGKDCAPAWDGDTTLDDATDVGDDIDAIRDADGDVSVSVGGYAGTKLGETCDSGEDAAAAYQNVVDKYSLHAIDFDLEEPEIEDSDAIHRELVAAKTLQKDNSDLYVSVTIPTIESGANHFGQKLLDDSDDIGFTPDNFSIMAFEGSFSDADDQIGALENFNDQLQDTFDWDSGTAYAHEGFSGMNGRDDNGNHFSQNDFQDVLDFTLDHDMARFTYWSVNRDRECDPPDKGSTEPDCSSVSQDAWGFTEFTADFGAGDDNSDGDGDGDDGSDGDDTSDCVSDWESDTAYTADDEVSYDGDNWKAVQWNFNQKPDNGSAVWENEGSCSSG